MRLMMLVPASVAAVAISVAAQQTPRPPQAVTFSETIAPILYANCVTCHRPGEAAPFSLISYDDVRARASLIVAATASRYMPPWHAAHGYGEFADERRLTDEQIATIGTWVKQGMPRGDMSRMPPMPTFADGWQLGKPDLVLEMPEAFEVPASGPDIYRNFAIPLGLTEDKWVRAVEFRPSARKLVHHAIFEYVRSGTTAGWNGKDGQPGYPGIAPTALGGLIPGFAPAGNLGAWAVGATPAFLPDGLALPVAKGTDFILQLHLHPTGKIEHERSTIGIYFADEAPARRVWTMGTPGFFGFFTNLDIPPGEREYAITGQLRMPVDMQLFSVAAHAHYLGKEMKATAALPDGTTRPLLWIQRWDFNWQDRYFYKAPILLPAGTTIDVRITYDNSADNPHNPARPPTRVQWGEQSADEMGGLQFQLVTVRKEDEDVVLRNAGVNLRAAFARLAQSKELREYMQRRAARDASPR